MMPNLKSPKHEAEALDVYKRQDLYRVIRDYGEDKFAKNIAKHIVQARAVKPCLLYTSYIKFKNRGT